MTVLRLRQMSGIISHPFFNLEFTTQFPILAPPPFYTIAKTIESIHLIDRKILDNLTTLFRGLPQREIINALLSETKTWEKAFYHLLKEYHERQSEEYGHGMSFVDFTPKEELQVVSSKGRYQHLGEYRPMSTIESSDEKSSIPAKPRNRPANGNEVGERPDAERRSILTPLATRAAPSPAFPTRRHRSAMVGPRPHSIAGSPTESLDPTMSGTSAINHRTLNPTARPTPAAPENINIQEESADVGVAHHTHAVGRSPPTRIPSLSLATASTHSHSNHSNTATDGNDDSSSRPMSIVPSSAAAPSLATPHPPSPRVDQKIEHRLLEQRLRNATVMRTSCPPSIDHRSSVIGLGLTLPTVAKQPNTSPPITSISEKRTSLKLPVPAGPRAQPLPLSPKPVSPEIPPSVMDKLVEHSQMERNGPTRRHKSESRQSKIPVDHVKRNSLAVPATELTPGLAVYPSPPPSQASSLEPFLALHHSPVFAQRFSLHLDAMLPQFRSSLMSDVKTIPDDTDNAEQRDPQEAEGATVRIVREEKRDESSGTTETVDWEVVCNEESYPPPSSGYESHERVSSSLDRPLPQLPLETHQPGRNSSADRSSNAILASDMGNVGGLSKSSHTVPASGVSEKENLQSPMRITDSVSSSHRNPAERATRKQRGTCPTWTCSGLRDRASSLAVPPDFVKPKKLTRMSTFVAAPPSPIPTPVLEPVGLSWFAQLFNVKPAVGAFFTKYFHGPNVYVLKAYVFHSQDNYIKTRDECATLLRSFGVSVVEVESSNRYGLLKCHVDYIQGRHRPCVSCSTC
jgi:hypothetical protein